MSSIRQARIDCSRVIPTADRRGGEGVYIVRLSEANRRRVGVNDKAYVCVHYKDQSATARLVVSSELDDDTVQVDQTIRAAIGIETFLQRQESNELVFSPSDDSALTEPIRVEASAFKGPGIWERLLKYQYLLCRVHLALPEDMEKPIARLAQNSMEIIGVRPGDKVRLVSETGTLSIRCLSLPADKNPPLSNMEKYPGLDFENQLPWCVVDLKTRNQLGVKPWESVLVGRDVGQVVKAELQSFSLASVLGILGLVLTLKPDWLPAALIVSGVLVVGLILIQVHSRL